MDRTQSTPNTVLRTTTLNRTLDNTMTTTEAEGLETNKLRDNDTILGWVLSLIVLTINPLERIESNLLHRDVCGAFGYLLLPEEEQNNIGTGSASEGFDNTDSHTDTMCVLSNFIVNFSHTQWRHMTLPCHTIGVMKLVNQILEILRSCLIQNHIICQDGVLLVTDCPVMKGTLHL